MVGCYIVLEKQRCAEFSGSPRRDVRLRGSHVLGHVVGRWLEFRVNIVGASVSGQIEQIIERKPVVLMAEIVENGCRYRRRPTVVPY